jgi:hypothetical protein
VFEEIYAIVAGIFMIAAYFFKWSWFYRLGERRSFVHLIWGQTGSRNASLVFGILFFSAGFYALIRQL